MIGSTSRQASLFYFAFAKEVLAITDDVLDPLDLLLDDPQLVQLAAQALAKRRKRSADFGRPSIAPDRLLRCAILKHLKDWSSRQFALGGQHPRAHARPPTDRRRLPKRSFESCGP